MKTPFALLVALAGLQPCLGKCYYPNGREAADFPCDPDSTDTVCCSDGRVDGFACLSNKLCQTPQGRIIRGTCTDPTWKSAACASYCMRRSLRRPRHPSDDD
jgi:hypothetical protein